MKKILSSLLLAVILLFSACASDELYILSDDTNWKEADSISPIADYKYENYEVASAVKPSEYTWYNRTSRGIVFMPNDGIMRVYNPETGSFNTLCPDPLCTHYPYSGCPYGNCIFTGSIPTEYNGRLYYYIKDEYFKNEQQYTEYLIYSTDLTGQNINKLYQNSGNYIFGLTLNNDCAFFLEVNDTGHVQLKSINTNNEKVSVLDTGKEDAIIDSFLIMNDTIYLMFSTGELYSCDLEFESVSLEYNIKRVPTIHGLADMNKLYWFLDNTIYEYDPSTKRCEELLSIEKGMRFINYFIEDEGLYYQAVPDSITYSMLYKDYAAIIKEHNTLNFIDPHTMKVETYDLPADMYLEPNTTTICNDLLISQVFIENSQTKKLAGRPYKSYDLKKQKIYTITE